MTKELRIFQNKFGRPELLLNIINTGKTPVILFDLIILLEKKGYVFRSEINGSINLLEWLGVLKKKNNKIVTLVNISSNDELLSMLIEKLSNNNLLLKIIPIDSFRYDEVDKKLYISASSIALENSSIRHLFYSLGLFEIKSKVIYEISEKYTDVLFHFFESIGNNFKFDTRVLSLADLIKIKNLQAENGREAEKRAFLFEKNRLENHPYLKNIKIISEIDTTKGFDIISFESLDSKDYDRFIEVKSVSFGTRFYWSKNEVETAKRLGKKYYLYIVRMTDDEGKIEIINNPYIIFKSKEWQKSVNTWEIDRVK